MRSQVAGGEQEQQRSFENKISPYHAMVELLVAQDKTSEALAYAERAKARVLLDVLQSGRSNITKAMTAQERENERRLRNELVSLNSQISARANVPNPTNRVWPTSGHVCKCAARIRSVSDKSLRGPPGIESATRRGGTITLEEAAGLLPEPESALLEYVVTEEKTYLFVLSKGKDINQRHCEFKGVRAGDQAEGTCRPRRRVPPAIGEARFDLPAGRDQIARGIGEAALAELKTKQTLVIVPDGALWELPFKLCRTRVADTD